MNRASTKLLTGLALALLAGLASPVQAIAQDASPIAAYRQSLMQAFRTHMGGVRASMGDAVPAGHAEHHAIAFNRMAMALANAFPEGSAGPGSRALPDELLGGIVSRTDGVPLFVEELTKAVLETGPCSPASTPGSAAADLGAAPETMLALVEGGDEARERVARAADFVAAQPGRLTTRACGRFSASARPRFGGVI